ncbi:MAG: InlB B-repeat-containing protein [Alphaproteobacteria bacterium]|nr:InlB B-repeat-containing protein [Alphaproteobacteria bacterium]
MAGIKPFYNMLKRLIFAIFVVFTANSAFAACASNQIDVNGDGTKCEDVKFTLDLSRSSNITVFNFFMSAKGTFYVDCGNGGTLTSNSATNYPVSGKTVNRTYGTGNVRYSCTWANGSKTQTIRFGGVAEGYSTNTSTAAIRFNYNATQAAYITSVSGNLSAMFPYITNNAQSGAQPRFYMTFDKATNLKSIPDTLFANYTTPATNMFHSTFNNSGLTSIPSNLFSTISGAAEGLFSSTFNGCTGLTSIPGNLFSTISGAANSLFYGTFQNCTGLTSIPSNLFSGVSGGASSMFFFTFKGCTGLTSIPGNLFSTISGAANSLFYGTFSGCTGLTSIPSNLFSTISGAADGLFSNTFNGCTGLTSIPGNLFSGVSGGASSMFSYTFNDCSSISAIPAGLFSGVNQAATGLFMNAFSGSGVSGYIPPTTFSGLISAGSPQSSDMWLDTFSYTNLTATCPQGTTQYMTGYEGGTNGPTWNGMVSCTPNSTTAIAVTLDSAGATTNATPSTIYLRYEDRWYSNSALSVQISSLNTIPSKTGYMFGGFYTQPNGSGIQIINSNGYILQTMEAITFTTTPTTVYAYWIEPKFTLTTSSTNSFQFKLSAAGTFYVDCGNGGTLSGTGASGNTITRADTTEATYTCSWTNSATRTIRFSGAATGYNSSYGVAAIKFNMTDAATDANAALLTGMSGTLGSIFGTVATASTGSVQPAFNKTFYGASNLNASIPSNFFAGVHGAPRGGMFQQTFSGCSSLTGSIPETLFCENTTNPSASNCIYGAPIGAMFEHTFLGCSGLTGSIPEKLFVGIHGAPASYMFSQTFNGCSGLTGSIPEKLFCQNTTSPSASNCIYGAPASSMFALTFYGCSGLTGSIPEKLFVGIHGAPANNMFQQTFYNCSGLTGSIPEKLFCQNTTSPSTSNCIYGAPARAMFFHTFSGCTNLTGLIPQNLFKGIYGAPAENMFNGTFRNDNKLTGITDGTTTTTYVPSTFLSAINNTSATTPATGMFTGTGLASSCPTWAAAATPVWATDAGKPWCEPDIKFTLNTLATNSFQFKLSAAGTFYVDCGNGGRLSVVNGNGTVSGNTITKTGTSWGTFECSWDDTEPQTLRFGGAASGYTASQSGGAIRFNVSDTNQDDDTNAPKITGISGSLGAIFGTIDGTVSPTGAESQPRFYGTFWAASNLAGSIPDELFYGIHGTPISYMFNRTFRGCSSLTGKIPETLFCQNTSNPNASNCIYGAPTQQMFYMTFHGCSGLTGNSSTGYAIPAKLFAGIRGDPSSASSVFGYTFSGCSGLNGQIPETLFCQNPNSPSASNCIYGAPASNMFSFTFQGCTGLTGDGIHAVPVKLFAGLHGAPAPKMFQSTFTGDTGLTGEIPPALFCGGNTNNLSNPSASNCIYGTPATEMFNSTFYNTRITHVDKNMFAGISGTSAEKMFYRTFKSCSSLSYINDTFNTKATTYIPSDFLGGITDGSVTNDATEMFTGTGLTSPCPTGTATATPAWATDAAKPWCAPNTYSITYDMNGGTNYSGAPTTYVYGTSTTINGAPTKSGYIFKGWTGSNGSTPQPTVTIGASATGAKSYTANWETAKFTLTTSGMSDFSFKLSPKGTFYVDCGNGGTLSGQSASGSTVSVNTITRTTTTATTYTCSWASSAGNKTISFGGSATNTTTTYNSDTNVPAIHFLESSNADSIKSVSGNLSAMFPYITSNAQSGAQPRFNRTFYDATHLTSVPDTLFANYTTPATYMFSNTFASSGLTSIPAGLFSRITGAATGLFEGTFSGARLTSVPAGLFAGISGVADSLFNSTFTGTPITSIPENLFAGVSGSASGVFSYAFYRCASLATITNGQTSTTYVPGTFLSDVTGNDNYIGADMFGMTDLADTCPYGMGDTTPAWASDAGKPWCSPNTYTITYSAGQGGVGANQTENVVFGTTFTTKSANTFSKPHATFTGWDTLEYSSAWTQPDTTYTYDLPSDITIAAQWTCDSGYTLNNSTGNCDANSITCDPGFYLKGNTLTCTACPAGKYCAGGTYTHNGTDLGITGDVTAGYFASGGAKVAAPTSNSDCLSGNTCGKCTTDSATGRPAYSTAGAASCSACPAVTGDMASRVISYAGWWSNDIHNAVTGCAAWFNDTDNDATFRVYCYYNTTDGAYGGSNSICQVWHPTACAAGKYDTIESTTEWLASANYTRGKGVDFMNGKVCTNTDAGYYSAEGSLTQTACAAGSYSSAGASTCTACPAGKTTAGTGTAFNTNANTTCSTSCSSIANLKTWNSQTWNSANNTVTNLCTVATCNAGAYKSGNTCPVCGANSWSDDGASSCTACNTTNGYTNSGTTAAAHAGQYSCKTTCAAGKQVASPGEACSTPGGSWYSVQHTVGEGSTSAVQLISNPNVFDCLIGGYATPDTTIQTDHDASTDCRITCSAGSRVTTPNGMCTAITSGNVYMLEHTVAQGSTSPKATSCPTSYTISGSTQADHDAKNDCKITCGAGYVVDTEDGNCIVPEEGFQTGIHTVSAGSVTRIDKDPGMNVPRAGIWYDCLTNYSATGKSAINHDQRSDCKITCNAGTQIATNNATRCTTPTGSWYTEQHTVSAGSTSSPTSCATGYATANTSTATDHDAQADCKIGCSAGYYIPTAGGGCKACPAGKYCTAISGIAETATSAATGNITAGYFASGGAKVATPTSSSDCLSGNTCGTCQGQNGPNGRPLYTDATGGAAQCSECPAVEASLTSRVVSYGYWPDTRDRGIQNCSAKFTDTDPDATFTTECYYRGSNYHESFNCQTAAPTACAAGKYETIRTTDKWGTYYAIGTGVDHMNGKVCTDTDAGYYSAEGSLTQTACATGSYSSAGASTCTACPAGKTTAGTGTAFNTNANTTCSTSCSSITNLKTWNSQTWNSSNNTVTNLCTVATCNAGAYKSGNTCPVCGANSWSDAGASSCTACQTDYTNSGTTATNHAGNASCKITVSGGHYIGTPGQNSTNWGTCDAGTFKAQHTVAYGSTSSCSNCEGRTKYSAAGASSCSTVSSGYYSTGCTSNNNCTGQSQCTGATYCASGVQNNCPTAESTWTQGTGNGWTAVTQCFETKNATDVSSYCSAGQLKKNATNTTTWGDSTISTALKAKAGSIVSGQTCTQCTGATFSAGDTATSCSACPTGYDANTDAGKSTNTQCQISVTGGHYIGTKGQTSSNWDTCAAGTYKAAHTVNYNSTSSCSNCEGRTKYSAAGASSCSTVTSGYYSTGCDTSTNNNCTGQSKCTGKTYCTNGVQEDCPAAADHKRTTFPAAYYSPTITSTSIMSASRRKAITECKASSTMTGARGTLIDQATYNPTTEEYDTTTWYGYYNVKPGYYLTTTGSCGTYAYYQNAEICPDGAYCPGKAGVKCDSSNEATVHTPTFGLEECSALNSEYTKSDSGRNAATDCYLNTTATKYVATAGENQVDCIADGYCPGNVKIYYNSIGGRTACPATAPYSGAGMSRPEQCGRKLHIGDNVMYLRSEKATTPSLNVNFGGMTYYGNMAETQANITSSSTKELKIKYKNNNKLYYLCDDTTCPEADND